MENELRAEFNKLPSEFRSQLENLIPYFENNKSVREKAKELQQEHHLDKHSKLAFLMAIFKTMTPNDILKDPTLLENVYCYAPTRLNSNNQRPNRIILTGIIKEGKHVKVLSGKMISSDKDPGLDVVVKWYQSKHGTIEREMETYKKLKEAGCEVPWFSVRFAFWEHPVLVMEKLYPLDKNDHENRVGIHVLKQLRYLHKFAVHSDLKPGNIMKRTRPGEGTRYYVIDYGGCSFESTKCDKHDIKYKRWVWTEKFASQPRPSETKNREPIYTYPYYDFLELLYTLRSIQMQRRNEKKEQKSNVITDKGVSAAQFREGYRRNLLKYHKKMQNLPMHPKNEDYDEFIRILSANY